jgi:hypothetical protein
MTEPPSMGGQLTANSSEERLDPPNDPLGLPTTEPPLLNRKPDTSPAITPSASPPVGSAFTPPPPSWTPPSQPLGDNDRTLTELEESIDSPHIKAESVDEARDEVSQALNDTAGSLPEPIQALGAQQIGGDLHPANGTAAGSSDDNSTPQVSDPTAPPPVPPPIPFQFGNPSPPQT